MDCGKEVLNDRCAVQLSDDTNCGATAEGTKAVNEDRERRQEKTTMT
jgi:hypothetical protein